MLLNKPTILITAGVDESLLNEITAKGFVADVIPFIKTEIIQSKKIQAQIENIAQQNATIVFTSKNAVNAVAPHLQNKKPGWKIYSTANATRNLIEKLFDKDSIAGVGNNAADLAEQIIKDNKATEVYFFCGDKKRDELPSLLAKNNIVAKEIEVYTTTIIKNRIKKNYDGILFFSPGAAEGFFAVNNINNKTILFAIGNTTADEIKKHSGNKIVVSDKAEKKYLAEKMIEFFKG